MKNNGETFENGIFVWPMTDAEDDYFPAVVYGYVADGTDDKGEPNYRAERAYLSACKCEPWRWVSVGNYILNKPLKYKPADGKAHGSTVIPVHITTDLNQFGRRDLLTIHYMGLECETTAGRKVYIHALPFCKDYERYRDKYGNRGVNESRFFPLADWPIFASESLSLDLGFADEEEVCDITVLGMDEIVKIRKGAT